MAERNRYRVDYPNLQNLIPQIAYLKQIPHRYNPHSFLLVDFLGKVTSHTAGHSLEVAIGTYRFANLLIDRNFQGLSKGEDGDITEAALLHDVGKGFFFDLVESKYPLGEQFETMKQHVKFGHDYLKKLGYKKILPIVIASHEYYDGTGYPFGLLGDNIPIGARLIKLIDVFSALINNRPYRKRDDLDRILEEVRTNLGTKFDARLGSLFLQNWKQIMASV